MKANEAPEKLYFGEFDKVVLDIYSNRESESEVEYARIDAFIEKACEFLNCKIKKGGYLCDSYIKQVKEEFIDDFRKYMKGE